MPDPAPDQLEQLAAWLDHGVGPGGARSYLRKVQARLHWVPREAIGLASEHYQVSYASLMEALSFEPGFSLEPRGERVLEVCQGLACRDRGAYALLESLERVSGLKRGETAADGSCSLLAAPCLGLCAMGVNVVMNGRKRSGFGPDSAPLLNEWMRGGDQ